MTEELRFIDRSVFLGLGAYDYLVSPTSRKKIFERSGHYAMLEEPETFDEELLRWMEETQG
ncbi:hypothetical protein FE782_18630 [Paenibacillus antri]|uniref:Alpha/beta hydrolase n=1 Tax=Paenibacillus antri TaxID=2582848 RepID=A0A5R9GBH4_9BACL|nr:alpha/beta hydrolase [Paenibacillus antri]TLS50718.1 hypothetical protein FE782_18630 [Paenibacillus antri]